MTTVCSIILFLAVLSMVDFIGSLPHSKRSVNDEVIRNLTCFENCHRISASSQTSIKVRCPACDIQDCYVVGTSFYTSRSGICCSGIHDGVITNAGGIMKVTIYNSRKNNYRGSLQHNIQSHYYLLMWQKYFILEGISNPTTTAESPTTAELITTTMTAMKLSKGKDQTTLAGITNSEQSTTMQNAFPQFGSKSNTSLVATENAQIVNSTKSVSMIPPGITKSEPSTTMQNPFPQLANEVSALRIAQDDAEIMNSTQHISMTTQNTTLIKTFLNIKQEFLHSKEFLIVIGVGSAITVALLLLAARYSRTLSRTWRRRVYIRKIRRATRENECVCYVGADSSVQGLLSDPETCERPCHVREQFQSLEEKSCHEGPECEGCSGEKCVSSKYDF